MEIEFRASPGPSLGIEVELELVDRETRDLVSRASDLLAQMADRHGDGHEHPKAKHELFECTVEVITGVCTTVAEARKDLHDTIDQLARVADEEGIGLMCSGTHPFSDWSQQQISPSPRYAKLIEDMGWVARRMQIFGVHYHVGVRSAEKAIAIANAMCAYLPHLLALSSSSPYWGGHDTGLASARSKVFEGLPTAGLPEQIATWEEFCSFMETLVSARAISTIREVWWDIRPHPNFGTVELRMCDGLPTLTEVAALGAMAQCLVEWQNQFIDRGYSLPVPREWVLRQNKWRAARHGLDADIIVDDGGSTQPVRQAIDELVEELQPVARRLGCADELAGVRSILAHGSSAERQRRLVAAGGSMLDVVDLLLAEMAAGEPLPTGGADDRPSPVPTA